MDTQKFMFVLETHTREELQLDASDLLMDLKNCTASIGSYGSEILSHINSFNYAPTKHHIDMCIACIKSLAQSYDLLAAQRKSVLYRISELDKYSHIKLES